MMEGSGEGYPLAASNADADEIWARTRALLAGATTSAEARGSRVFALERLAMSM